MNIDHDKIDKLNEMKKIQRQSAFDNNYQLGLYNGIEFSLSLLEDRSPIFLTLPIEENI